MSEKKLDFEQSMYDNVLYADGFEDAMIGIGIQGGTHKAVAVYNIEKMEQKVIILMTTLYVCIYGIRMV